MSRPVRVLIVDDSPAMRAALKAILEADPDIEVVGRAAEPHEARALIKQLDPDVITLDVEMPGMDGLAFLERIMRLRPMPVVMCSTLTSRGAEATIEALRLGAVDCIAKPSGNAAEIALQADALRRTVKAAAVSKVGGARRGEPVRSADRLAPDRLIAVAASTGGVEALFALVEALPANCPPVLIVQHMPGAFTAGFAGRLDAVGPLRVKEAQDGEPARPGQVYVAPGGAYHMAVRPGSAPLIRLLDQPAEGGHRPAADVLFRSVAALGSRGVGVILTGMGQDGAAGLLAMRQAGARTFGQSPDGCVVYGMPRAAWELGAVERQVGLPAMANAIVGACRA